MKTAALFVVALAGATVNAQDLIAYWNFNNSTAGSQGGLGTLAPAGFNADQGAGTITTNIAINTVAGAPATNTGTLGTFGGDLINALNGDPTGGALAVQGGANQVNNGRYIQFEFDASLYTGIDISWAGRGTGTGFGSDAAPNTIQFSTDGVTFTNLATYTSRQTTFQLYSFDFGSSLDLASDAFIRIVFNGSSSTSGNNRLDNVQITGTLVPAPASLALIGMSGLVAARRRRG